MKKEKHKGWIKLVPENQNEHKKETMGSQILRVREKGLYYGHTARDQINEMVPTLIETLKSQIKETSKVYVMDIFFIQTRMFMDPALGAEAFRSMYISSMFPFKPEYDSDVYKCNKKTEKIELLWSIPSEFDCNYYEKIVQPHKGEKYVWLSAKEFNAGKYQEIYNLFNNKTALA